MKRLFKFRLFKFRLFKFNRYFGVGLLVALVWGWGGELAQARFYKIHQQYLSPRVMGMGGAFVALADDETALFYNPAGLTQLSEGKINLSLNAGGTLAISNLFNDISAAGEAPDKEGAIISVLNDVMGKNYSIRAPLLQAFWVRPTWGIAIIPADVSVDLGIRQGIGPSLEVSSIADATIAIGFAKAIYPKQWSIGTTLKFVYRGNFDAQLQAPELAVNSKLVRDDQAKEGMTFDLDIGTIYTPPPAQSGFFKFTKVFKPSFGLAVRNAVDYGFKQNFHLINKESTLPAKVGRRIDVGMNWEWPKFWVFQPRSGIDLRDIGHRYWTVMKGLHIGAELDVVFAWWAQGAFRFGLNQGYFTAGLGGKFVWLKYDFSTWGEEFGTSQARSENRIVMAKLGLDF